MKREPKISPEITRAANYLREQDRIAPAPLGKPSRAQLALVAADEYLNQPPAPDAVSAALVGELVSLVTIVPAPIDLRLISVGSSTFTPVSTCDPVDVAIQVDRRSQS